jgi:hypothetical protein
MVRVAATLNLKVLEVLLVEDLHIPIYLIKFFIKR